MPAPMKAVLLYVGKDYVEPTVSQLNSLYNVTHFVIIPGLYKLRYGDPNNRALIDEASTEAANFVKNVVKLSAHANKKLYIGTPTFNIDTTNDINNLPNLYPFVRDYIDMLQNKLGTDWGTMVEGIYMNLEAVHPVYQLVDVNNITANPTCKLFNDVSYRVRVTKGKKFLWIPYYGHGPNAYNVIWNMACVVNRKDWFDYCLIQPNYFWNPSVAANLDGVRYSVDKQMICYRDGVPAAGGRTSTLTVIGVEMEIDSSIYNDSGKASRYQQYEAKYDPVVNYPFAYYAGNAYSLFSTPKGPYWTKSIVDTIGDFYSRR